jgi:hypothetical protein
MALQGLTGRAAYMAISRHAKLLAARRDWFQAHALVAKGLLDSPTGLGVPPEEKLHQVLAAVVGAVLARMLGRVLFVWGRARACLTPFAWKHEKFTEEPYGNPQVKWRQRIAVLRWGKWQHEEYGWPSGCPPHEVEKRLAAMSRRAAYAEIRLHAQFLKAIEEGWYRIFNTTEELFLSRRIARALGRRLFPLYWEAERGVQNKLLLKVWRWGQPTLEVWRRPSTGGRPPELSSVGPLAMWRGYKRLAQHSEKVAEGSADWRVAGEVRNKAFANDATSASKA